MLIDTHAHLTDEKFRQDRDEVVARALQSGLAYILNVGDNLDRSKQAVDYANENGRVYASAGIHPHEAAEGGEGAYETLLELASSERVVAIGEIGLDYYYEIEPRDRQKIVFSDQLELALEAGLPVIVHDRDAHADTLEVLKRFTDRGLRGVMHCFSGGAELARRFVSMGLYVSLAGPVTFKNARKPVEVALEVPIDRLLVETDCPYLAPVPRRGQRNEPSYVRCVAERIADIRGLDRDELFRAVTENAMELFGFPSTG